MRRSRIIISENNDNPTDLKREIYDPETKYIKSMLSARNYNDMLMEIRSANSKHFLKRKIKFAYEREPLDKSKSFFNIPFYPSANMFAAPPQPQPQPPANLLGQNPKPSASNAVNSQHQHMTKAELRNMQNTNQMSNFNSL